MKRNKWWMRTWIRTRPVRKAQDPDVVAGYEAWEKARQRASRNEAPSIRDWMTIWSGTCYVCDQRPARGVDHVVPLSKGGRNLVRNLLPACIKCNRAKSDTILLDHERVIADYWRAGQ